jgi:hypothetical protein
MTVLRVTGGRVSVEDSIAVTPPLTGEHLRVAYLHDVPKLTLGLVRVRGTSVYVGPIEVLRFGPPKVTPNAVEWPIEGGIAARSPGGRWRIEAKGGHVVASVEGYRPRLPLPLYTLTQLPIHRLVIRLHLLRLRGREPAPGVPAAQRDRRQAAALDLAFCLMLAGLAGRRRKLSVLLGIAAAYHVACWSFSGRTLGGIVMRQRVVALDGSKPSFEQSVVRLLASPIAWALRRPIHDDAAGTDVITDSP